MNYVVIIAGIISTCFFAYIASKLLRNRKKGTTFAYISNKNLWPYRYMYIMLNGYLENKELEQKYNLKKGWLGKSIKLTGLQSAITGYIFLLGSLLTLYYFILSEILPINFI